MVVPSRSDLPWRAKRAALDAPAATAPEDDPAEEEWNPPQDDEAGADDSTYQTDHERSGLQLPDAIPF